MFPIVLVTVTALLYLMLLLFFHVYAYHVTEVAVETATRDVGGERVYWQLSSHSLDADTVVACSEAMDRKLKAMQIVPGLKFSSAFRENATGSRCIATADCVFRGKKLFSVRSERALRKPTEFAETVDLLEDVAVDTGLKDFLETRFGRYVDKEKMYL